MRNLIAVALLILSLLPGVSCGPKPDAKGPAKHYKISGRVVSVNPKDQTASIDAAAIPGYMEAMKMDYPIASKDQFETLRAGDEIQGDLDVYESGDYSITKIEKRAAAGPTGKQ